MCIVWHRQGQACSNGWQSLLWVGLRGMVRPSSGLSGNFDSVCKTYILGASLLPWYLQPEDCSWYWDCFDLDKVNPLPLPPCSAVYNKGAGLLGSWASSVRESGPDASFFFFLKTCVQEFKLVKEKKKDGSCSVWTSGSLRFILGYWAQSALTGLDYGKNRGWEGERDVHSTTIKRKLWQFWGLEREEDPWRKERIEL